MRKAASLGSIVLGALMVIGAVVTWFLVSTTLADAKITTSEDACLPNQTVDGPFTAYCEAQIIEEHALAATDGLTYAELDREDPRRATAMNASFLRASLFTSVVSFGVAAMAGGMGLIFILLGLGMKDVSDNLPKQTAGVR